ncbi:ATP-grasp domain-containing protein [Candidatus Nanohalococcus occultus]|uniref:ATP-grasp domain-containing protein n=1 Tax=Candidatus Nanohalococcus occultus TaxID=2978047 RepID=UPI0039DF7D66
MGIVYGEISTQHQLLMERADEIFETVLAVPVDSVEFVHGEETQVMYRGTDLTTFDAIYIRTGDQDQYFSEHLSEVLNEAGVITQAENDTYCYEANKFYSMKILAENHVNVPDSAYTLSPETALDAAERLGFPIILKTAQGAGGEGVMRVSSESELRPIMDAMRSFEQDIVLQEYIEHEGTDNRVIVIDDYVTAYARSSGSSDEWRSNISSGGERIHANLTDEMKETALTAARATGFDMCGCDIIQNNGEVYVLEVNGSFGINEEMNEIIGEDVILRMVERLHELAMEKQVQD